MKMIVSQIFDYYYVKFGQAHVGFIHTYVRAKSDSENWLIAYVYNRHA